jgi:hypothetical protein
MHGARIPNLPEDVFGEDARLLLIQNPGCPCQSFINSLVAPKRHRDGSPPVLATESGSPR